MPEQQVRVAVAAPWIKYCGWCRSIRTQSFLAVKFPQSHCPRAEPKNLGEAGQKCGYREALSQHAPYVAAEAKACTPDGQVRVSFYRSRSVGRAANTGSW